MNLISMIVAPPGSGKTTSLRNLGADTVILNVERKMLPFPDRGAYNIPIASTEKLFDTLVKLQNKPTIRVVALDSFSEFTDLLMAEANSRYKGFDVYKHYNGEIFQLFQLLKALENKYVFVMGHTEILLDEAGNRISRMKVKGKEYEGVVEKAATCVFQATARPNAANNGRVEYKFLTNTDGVVPAKTPMGMFDDLFIDNDVAAIVRRYDEYYNVTPPAIEAPDTTAETSAEAE